jgi:RNA polymerase sigma factor (sigma-70 family)
MQHESCKLDPDRQQLAEDYLHLIEPLAWQSFRRCGRMMPLDELLGEARLALTYGASKFDSQMGVPFGAYVTMVIRHRLTQAVNVWRRGGRLDHVCFTDLTRGSALFDLECPRANEATMESIVHEQVEQIRRILPARWFRVLLLYFGESYTFEDVARELGVSRERVRQLLAKAIARVRAHFAHDLDQCDRAIEPRQSA